MDDIDRALSLKLYDVMDKVGVSERCRKLYQDRAITNEIIVTIDNQITIDSQIFEDLTTYVFGSSSEGTTTLGLDSDEDHLCCIDSYPVIDDIRDAPRGHSYLMIRDNHTYPGYVKLQAVENRTPLTIYNAEITKDNEADNEGRLCMKHVRCSLSEHEHERHGPSDASHGHCNVDKDTVWALRCRTIPICAHMWLHPRRRYNWPSRDNLQKMGDLGCFVVGVGHSSSIEQHIEWRLSFSLQERVLMFSLNPTQHKCYVILKMIKKDIIKAEIGECLSSYHCKTCIFQTIQVTPAAIWKPDNLLCCVRLSLLILLTWVVNGVCPNYFIPSENMFEKPQFHANRYRLLDLLRLLIADGNLILLRLQCDNISNRILQPGILHNNMTDYLVYHNYLRLRMTISYFSYHMYNLANITPDICQNIMTLFQHIGRLANTCVIGEHTEQQTRDAISYVIPVLHFHIAQRLASLACQSQGQEHARLLLYLSFHYFIHGNNADLMTSRLLVVSLLLRLEKYDVCEIILEGIENDCKRYIVTNCECYPRPDQVNADLKQHLRRNNISCKTAIKTVYVCCVTFSRCDTEITPLPLQYEMYRSMGSTPLAPQHAGYNNESLEWLEWAVVDGKVYLYFLQYLVYSRLNRPANKQVAIDNLLWVVGDDPNLQHKETAFNLLGWIHVQEGRIPEALRCFVTSWQIRPDHNAAKFHILNLIQDMMRH